jgi:DNA uptake protein ComE-like DNA-binding protein
VARYSRARRGAIFVTAMWILIILGAMILVTARAVLTDATASANGLSAIQADAIEKAGVQYVLSVIDGAQGDAVGITGIDIEAFPVGDGYFWIIAPNLDYDAIQADYVYGIVDESSKLNLNTVASEQLQLLPGMTSDIADSIIDWRDADENVTNNGAESSFYLPLGYAAKNSPFETVEELKLVIDPKQLTPDPLYGYDLNRDGVLDQYEQSLAGGGSLGTAMNSASFDPRGWANYFTVNTVEPNTQRDGTARVDVNNDQAGLQQLLSDNLQANRATQIMGQLAPLYAAAQRAGNGGNNRSGGTTGTGGTTTGTGQQQQQAQAFSDLGKFYVASGMKPDEFKLIEDKVTTSTAKTLPGLINVNTASRAVLMCLPGITETDADSLISQRIGNSDNSSYAWIFNVLDAQKAAAITPYITARSFIYSADIVAVSGDGRSFKRVRIIVDAQTSPAKIIYRRDLTSLGWPLPREIQDQMRAGQFRPQTQGIGGMSSH